MNRQRTRSEAINEQDVADAMGRLEDRGVYPSITSLRLEIGRGSDGTIHQLKNKILAARGTEIGKQKTKPDLPPAMQRAMSQFIELEVNRVIEPLQQELQESIATADHLARSNETLTEAAEDLQRQLDESHADLERMTGQMEAQRAATELLERELARERDLVRSVHVELATAQLRNAMVPELQQTNARLGEDLELVRARCAEAEQRGAVANATKEGVEQRLADLRRALDEEQKARADAQAQLRAAQEEAKRLSQGTADLRVKLEVTSRDLSHANEQIKTLGAQVADERGNALAHEPGTAAPAARGDGAQSG